jgi:hypothetical protein
MNKSFAGIISYCSLMNKEAQAVTPQILNFFICSPCASVNAGDYYKIYYNSKFNRLILTDNIEI